MSIFNKLTVSATVTLLLAAGTAFAYTGSEFAKEAKVGLEQARAIALKAVPGRITDEELEREKGGSGFCCSFDREAGKVTHKVGVDAKTGELLENAVEGTHPD